MKPSTPITTDRLMKLTANMPMKQINIPRIERIEVAPGIDELVTSGESPYLQRYYAGQFSDDVDLWFHRFLSEDGESHVHSHPFEFTTVMLHGGYEEEGIDEIGRHEWRLTTAPDGSDLEGLLESYCHRLRSSIKTHTPSQHFLNSAAQYRKVGLYEWHRIAKVYQDTWTAVLVPRKRLAVWCFRDENDKVEIRKASEIDWFHNYKVRPESGIAVDDNGKG